jgi:hypothetical protein
MTDEIVTTENTSEISTNKRGGGILDANNHWLVLTESTRLEDGTWVHKCGTAIEQRILHQTEYDGIFLLSGSGKVRTMHIPFCPNCEAEPKVH